MSAPFPTSPASIDNFGGSKTDYSAVVDPTTDRSADDINAAYSCLSMLTKTPCQAILQFTGGVGPSITPSAHRALWGQSLAVIPIVTNTGTGIYSVALPSSFIDELTESHDINLTMAQGSIAGSTFGFVNVTKLTANTFEVRTANTSGTANNLAGAVITVAVY